MPLDSERSATTAVHAQRGRRCCACTALWADACLSIALMSAACLLACTVGANENALAARPAPCGRVDADSGCACGQQQALSLACSWRGWRMNGVRASTAARSACQGAAPHFSLAWRTQSSSHAPCVYVCYVLAKLLCYSSSSLLLSSSSCWHPLLRTRRPPHSQRRSAQPRALSRRHNSLRSHAHPARRRTAVFVPARSLLPAVASTRCCCFYCADVGTRCSSSSSSAVLAVRRAAPSPFRVRTLRWQSYRAAPA
jgi:hypothetical protein